MTEEAHPTKDAETLNWRRAERRMAIGFFGSVFAIIAVLVVIVVLTDDGKAPETGTTLFESLAAQANGLSFGGTAAVVAVAACLYYALTPHHRR